MLFLVGNWSVLFFIQTSSNRNNDASSLVEEEEVVGGIDGPHEACCSLKENPRSSYDLLTHCSNKLYFAIFIVSNRNVGIAE